MRRPRLRPRRPSPLQAALAGVAITVPIVAISVLMLRTATPAPDPAGRPPTFTMSAAWTLADLERRLAAGDVEALTTTGTPGRGDGHLVARLADGTLVDVQLAVPPEDAARSLAGLGYGNLLSDEAWGAARAAGPLATPPDPLRSLVSILVPLAIFGSLLVLVLWASRGRLARRRSTSSFAVVLPATAAGGNGASATTGATTMTAIRLDDVAGCDEAKVELTEVVEFLREPERFARLGATLPRGVLLYGPPGTGKTMLARAVATEAAVAFIHVSGSEFVEKYVGVGARRVRDLFAQARELGRAVVFIDEFDALAKARGGPNGHEEREQTLNQLLVELDGFSPNDNVVVIAATNRLDTLDVAVLRPGRFNRKIHVGLPDVRGRQEILAVHARHKPLDAGIDLGSLARKTYGFSGAQLADLLNEAAILAARRSGDSIATGDIQAGWLKVAVGTGRRRSMDERERAIIAAHEVGHAICGRVHGDRRRVEEISLFAHGEALGVTVSSQEDNDLPSESDLRARLVALMGGRAAEELLFHEVTGGASNDFEKATQIATTMVTRFGMGRDPEADESGPSGRGVLSLLVARSGGSLPSEVQPAATRAVRAILDAAYANACDTLAAHLPTLRRIAAHLVEAERIDGETFAELFDGVRSDATADGEWRPTTARPRAWDDVIPFRDLRRRRPLVAGQPSLEPVAAQVPVPIAAVAGDAADPAGPTADGRAAAMVGVGPEAEPGPSGPSGPSMPAVPSGSPTVHVPPRAATYRRSAFAPGVRRHGRLRRVAAGWLLGVSVRIAPTDPPAA